MIGKSSPNIREPNPGISRTSRAKPTSTNGCREPGASTGCDRRATRSDLDGTVDRIEGFATEGEAGRWIKNESSVWLNAHRNDKAANWGPAVVSSLFAEIGHFHVGWLYLILGGAGSGLGRGILRNPPIFYRHARLAVAGSGIMCRKIPSVRFGRIVVDAFCRRAIRSQHKPCHRSA